MSSVRESSHVSRKYVSHGATISGQGHSVNSTNSLENNLDALLEDLQTSVSRSATPSGRRPISPQVEYRTAANPVKTVTEIRSISPTRTTTTTREKYVNTGPNGVGSGILGFEALDSELRNVQPGQSKTVAYKQVSYQYNKSRDGKPIDSFATSDNMMTSSTTPLSDDIHETSYEEIHRRKNAEKTTFTKTSTVNRELVYGDTYSSSRSKQTSPLPGSQSRDVKIIRETTAYPEPKAVSTTYNTATRERIQEYGVEQVPVPSPTPTIPLNLAPGPNTKVTTTIKTYTYELPGAPEHYLPVGHTGTDQTVTYKIDKTLERSASPIRYTSTPEINQKSSILHKESKYYQEELRGSPNYGKPISFPSAPSPTNLETTTTKKENFYIRDERYENSYTPVDRTDYPGHPNQPPYTETTTTTLIDRIEEHYPDKPASPTRGYYTALPQTPPLASSSVYKYSKESYNNSHASDREVLLPKPFPTGTQLYPVNGKGPSNGQGPPAKLDDLMASFSDSEREVLVDIQREESIKRKNKENTGEIQKKTVDFVGHSPPKVQSKNVAGPPVYYPPGSAEFKSKEEGAMMQASGEWARARGQYEYEASSKTKQKQTSGKAVVPVCLPLCCALPCVIM
ncbi:uncharacterized protein [Chelonus insularis]|uniref:uncharacterized protein n=1 Tax=Chelonus insularis TaxID=460826 RepID=UPI00158BF802|nr:uncharacterized protein LOC118064947 [Chelonus insularis]XP_034935799.1 uncharacterized protein LOC118064947 [Chelonus insularis]XP_034935800.1 uncharacterized protein LOC118064947 [Chelonus insularis]XP_034935801.1 uncharacterized protein LOC118064947 [Chelonus insularis]